MLRITLLTVWAPIIASATLNDFGHGLISQWLCNAALFSTPPQDNGILGVADDVIEALLPNDDISLDKSTKPISGLAIWDPVYPAGRHQTNWRQKRRR
jgi:hypothetical protein